MRPQPNAAALLDDSADEVAVAGLAGVAQRRQQPSFFRLALGNAPMDFAKALRILPQALVGAVVLQHRIQPQGVGVGAGLHQAVECRQGVDAPHVGGLQHLVGEGRRDPLEQGEIEQHLPVLVGEIAQQAFAKPIRGDARYPAPVPVRRPRLCGSRPAGGGTHVAVHAQRHWPAFGALGNRAQLAARERAVEETRDAFLGEPELIGGEVDAVAVQDRASQVQARVVAQRHGDVQVSWRVRQQEVQGVQGAGVAHHVHLVEQQEAGLGVGFDGDAQEFGAPPRPMRQRHALLGGLIAIRIRQPNAGVHERVGEVGVQDARGVLFV